VKKEHALFVLELADCGSLMDYVLNTGCFEEPFACVIFRQLLQGLYHCHSLGVYHRDLKPENVLLDRHLHFRIADFGFAIPAAREDLLQTILGTEMYMAPEVRARKQYRGAPADVWSLGAILFFTLTRTMPFPQQMAYWYWGCIKSGRYDVFWSAHERVIPELSPAVKDLLNRIFVMDPEQRITLEQLSAHPWVTLTPTPTQEVLVEVMHQRLRVVAALQAKLDCRSVEETFGSMADVSRLTDTNSEIQPPLVVRLALDSNPTLLTFFHRSLTPDTFQRLLNNSESTAPAA